MDLVANAAVMGTAVTPGLVGAGFDMRNWHPGKGAGDLTDYGDCTLMTLQFLQAEEWDLDVFEKTWKSWIANYQGYVNFATKALLKKGELGEAEDLFPLCRLPQS